MASANERRRNNVRAGIFVTLALVLALGVVITISNVGHSLLERTRSYTVRYPVGAGVGSLQPGSKVRIGGVSMGSVRDVRPLTEGPGFEEIDVVFDVREEVELFEGATILVGAPILGSEAWLSITSVGTVGATLGPDQVIPGSRGPGMLARVLGPESAARVPKILENAEVFTDDLKEMPGNIETQMDPIFTNLQDTTGNMRDMVAEFRDGPLPRWVESVDDVMSWAVGFTERLDGAVEQADGLMVDARDVVAENRLDLRKVLENSNAASADLAAVMVRVRDETVDKVNRVLDSGQDGLDQAVVLVRRIRTDYEGWEHRFSETLANADLASQQLKLGLAELRRSPWKLLYRPDTSELDHELLYEATRSFAVAAADLKAASASADRILSEHRDAIAQDPALLEKVSRNLVEPLDKYEQAQQRLFDVLLVETP